MQSSLCPLPPVPAVRKRYAELHKLVVTVSRKISNRTKFSAEISEISTTTHFDQPNFIMTHVTRPRNFLCYHWSPLSKNLQTRQFGEKICHHQRKFFRLQATGKNPQGTTPFTAKGKP
jgi:hypothetical protein